MKRRMLMLIAGLGMSVLVSGGAESVLAGENKFDPWQEWGPSETGALPSSEIVKPSEKTVSPATRDEMKSGPSEFDLYPEKWQESGGE